MDKMDKMSRMDIGQGGQSQDQGQGGQNAHQVRGNSSDHGKQFSM